MIGGSGFIGRRLVERLRRAHRVSVLARGDSADHRVDVCDADAISRALSGHDAVVHLASEHGDDVTPSSRYDDVNVGGTANVLSALRRHAIRSLVFTSTAAVYGLDRGEPDEDSALAPSDAYGLSMQRAEGALRAWQSEESTRRLTIVRPAVVFGEGDRANVHALLRRIAAGPFLLIGDGANRKSLAYAENVADFLRFALESNAEGCRLFNYADKPDLDMNGLVALVRGELGRTRRPARIPRALGLLGGRAADVLARLSRRALPISAARVRKFCATTVLSAERAHAVFTPAIGLEQALRRTVAHEFGRSAD